MRSRVVIQRGVSDKTDKFGQPVVTWEDVVTVWANIRYLNGKEFLTAGTEVSAATVSVRIRYRTDITADMRVLIGDAILNIKAVLPDEAKREHVDLVCETGANNG
ncbi:MAG: phage head closure protein [Burkholderiales bacterium]|nr:phage head closure protein [Burkholderiales bacterium]